MKRFQIAFINAFNYFYRLNLVYLAFYLQNIMQIDFEIEEFNL